MPSSYDQIMQALDQADAAGNTEDARDLAEMAKQAQGASITPVAPAATPTDPNATLGGEFVKGLYSGAKPIGDFFNNMVIKGSQALGNPEAEAKARGILDSSTKFYDNYIGRNGPAAVPTVHDIGDAHDATLYTANTLGVASPYVLGLLGGGLAAAGGGGSAATIPAAVGAIGQGTDAYDKTGGDPAATAVGAGIGAAAGAIPVPFLKPGGALGSLGEAFTAPTAGASLRALLSTGGAMTGSAVRGAAGGAIAGGLQGAASSIPDAVHSGDAFDAVPSLGQIGEGAARGAVLGAAAGGLSGVMPKGRAGTDVVNAASNADEAAKARLAERIQGEAEQTGIELGKNVKYGAARGDEAVLEGVHNGIAEDIKALSGVLKDEMNPALAQNLDDLMNRSSLQSTLRDARNKTKGTASEEDISKLQDTVGHTQEGTALVDLVRQSNHLGDLFRDGMKGGISRYTDYASPFTRGGSETGRGFGAPDAIRGVEILHSITNPTTAIAGTGIALAGRAIDAAMGTRSKVASFVKSNIGNYSDLNVADKPSIIAQRFEATKASNPASPDTPVVDPEAQARLAVREQQLYLQKFTDNNPGLGGFLKSVYDQTGLMPKEASKGVYELNRTGALNSDEVAAFHSSPKDLMANNVGNHVLDMLHSMADKGQLQRDPNWQPQPSTSTVSPTTNQAGRSASYMAQARGNQDRITAAQNRVAASPHSPGSKEAINYAAATIGRTSNRADAMAVRDAVVKALPDPKAAAYAKQELTPLVGQIRHATRADAEAAREGRPLTPREKIDVAQKAEHLVENPSHETLVSAFGPDDAAVLLRMLNRYSYKTTNPDHAMLDTLVEFRKWVESGRPDNY